MDWMNWLLCCYGSGYWCLMVDFDEFLIYLYYDLWLLKVLIDWLDVLVMKSFLVMLLDMYFKGLLNSQFYVEGIDFFGIVGWFDLVNYVICKNGEYGNLWIQGGLCGCVFFCDNFEVGLVLNKILLVCWEWFYVYVSLIYMFLLWLLNVVYDEDGGECVLGCLLYVKFLFIFVEKFVEELMWCQYYVDSQEYMVYYLGLQDDFDLWCSELWCFEDWCQFEDFGLILKGNWV